MSSLTIFLCLLGALAVFQATEARHTRASTWDYTCTSDWQCQSRGHSWCSFAAAEVRDGVQRGWCQKGPRPGRSVSRRASTWDYTCRDDAQCIKRGHSWCSFAAAEVRDGVEVGWCKSGPKPGGPGNGGNNGGTGGNDGGNNGNNGGAGNDGGNGGTGNDGGNGGTGNDVNPPIVPPPALPPVPPPQTPNAGRWLNDIAGGRCWWTGCFSTQHAVRCPAATRNVFSTTDTCRPGDADTICCR